MEDVSEEGAVANWNSRLNDSQALNCSFLVMRFLFSLLLFSSAENSNLGCVRVGDRLLGVRLLDKGFFVRETNNLNDLSYDRIVQLLMHYMGNLLFLTMLLESDPVIVVVCFLQIDGDQTLTQL